MNKKRIPFSHEEVETIKTMYVNGREIDDISRKLKRSPDSIKSKISSLKIERRTTEEQVAFEQKLLEKISDFWEEKGHTPQLHQNQFGEVRSNMKNGIPEYLTTIKYLRK